MRRVSAFHRWQRLVAALHRRIKPFRCVECLVPLHHRGLCAYCWRCQHDRSRSGMLDWGLRPQIDEMPHWVRIR